jgi:hypothetical protein
MKILIRKFNGIWERDRAPHASLPGTPTAGGKTETTLEQAGLALGFVEGEMFVGEGGGDAATGGAVEEA